MGDYRRRRRLAMTPDRSNPEPSSVIVAGSGTAGTSPVPAV
jgi:hypothetical protein